MDYSKPHLVIPVPGATFSNPGVRELMSEDQLALLGYIDGYNSLAALPTLVQRTLEEVTNMVDRLLVLDMLRIFHREANRPVTPVGSNHINTPNESASSVSEDSATLFSFENMDKGTLFEPIDDVVIVGQLLPEEPPPPSQKIEDGAMVPWTYSHVPQQVVQAPQSSLATMMPTDPSTPDSWLELDSAPQHKATQKANASSPSESSRQFHGSAFFTDNTGTEESTQHGWGNQAKSTQQWRGIVTPEEEAHTGALPPISTPPRPHPKQSFLGSPTPPTLEEAPPPSISKTVVDDGFAHKTLGLDALLRRKQQVSQGQHNNDTIRVSSPSSSPRSRPNPSSLAGLSDFGDDHTINLRRKK